MRRLLSVLPLIAGCAAQPAPAPAQPTAAVLQQPRGAEAPGKPPPRDPPPNRCLASPPAKRPLPAPVLVTSTCVDHRRLEASMGRTLRKKFQPVRTGSTVEVSFDCDPLTTSVKEITVETGSGHGGSLTLWRIFRHGAGEDFHVFGLTHTEGWAPYDKYTYAVADRFQAQIARDRIPAKRVEKAVEVAATALTARFRELEPPPSPNLFLGGSFSVSSADVHYFVRLVDETGHVLERRFTGYLGSGGQASHLGLDLALTALGPLLEGHNFEASPPSESEREFFIDQYLAAQPRLHERFAWWVRERYSRLAGRIGTSAVVPALLGDLREKLSEVEAARDQPDRVSRLADPLLALAHVTGWDARLDGEGHERPMDEVAREYLNECGKALETAVLPGNPRPTDAN